MNCMIEETPLETKVLGELDEPQTEISPDNFVCELGGDACLVQSDSAENAAKATAEYYDDHNGTDVAWRVIVRPRAWNGNDAVHDSTEFVVTRERPRYRTFVAR